MDVCVCVCVSLHTQEELEQQMALVATHKHREAELMEEVDTKARELIVTKQEAEGSKTLYTALRTKIQVRQRSSVCCPWLLASSSNPATAPYSSLHTSLACCP